VRVTIISSTPQACLLSITLQVAFLHLGQSMFLVPFSLRVANLFKKFLQFGNFSALPVPLSGSQANNHSVLIPYIPDAVGRLEKRSIADANGDPDPVVYFSNMLFHGKPLLGT